MTNVDESTTTGVVLEIADGHCQGYNFCHDIGPDVYEIDGDGYNDMMGEGPKRFPGELADQAIEGLIACPVRAIRRVESPE